MLSHTMELISWQTQRKHKLNLHTTKITEKKHRQQTNVLYYNAAVNTAKQRENVYTQK